MPFSKLHDYQQAAIEKLYDNNNAYAVLPMGAGKTIIGMTVLKEFMEDSVVDRPLVLAPLRVAEITWPDEQEKWEHTQDFPLHVVPGNGEEWADPVLAKARLLFGARQACEKNLDSVIRKQDVETDKVHLAFLEEQKLQLKRKLKFLQEDEREVIKVLRQHEPAAGCYVSNYENIDWLTSHFKPGQMPFDMVVFDELGKLKNHRGARAKEMRKHSRLMKIRHGLNGTPAPEGLIDLFGQVLMLDNGETWGKNYGDWRRQYFVPADYRGHNWTLQPGGQTRIYEDLDHLVFKVPEDSLTYKPGMELIPVYVKLDEKSMAKYRKMERELAVALGVETDSARDALLTMEDPDVVIASNAAVASSKMRQIIQGFIYREDGSFQELHGIKFKALLELLESRQGMPTLVAYEFQADLKRIQKKWPGIPYLGHGVSSAKARKIVRDWNAGKIPILPVHPASAGHGLNLQHGGSHIIWYNVVWPREYFDQTNARIDRQGQTKKCFGHLIIAKGTIEEKVVWPRLQRKGKEQADFIQAVRSVLV